LILAHRLVHNNFAKLMPSRRMTHEIASGLS
jgi:hypothetical protein